MIKRKLTKADYFLIAANLLPVLGTWCWGWDAKEVFIIYCLETVIIGVFTLIRMGIVTAVRKTDLWYNQGSATMTSGVFFMLFFLVHYGFFVAIQTGLVIQVSGIGKNTHAGFFDFFFNWPKYIHGDTGAMMAAFLISYAYKMLWDFILKKEYKTVSMMKLMFQPYGRIFIQQVTVILGSIFLSFGAGKIFILVFALVKIFFEIFINYEQMLNKGMKEMDPETAATLKSITNDDSK